jgi:chorismate mutase/prephenate dehydrogenase
VPASLDELRTRIAALDAALVELVASRLALVREVGDAKRATGQPVRSYATESEVLERLQRLAAAAGLDEHLGERIGHLLIGEAVRTQELGLGTGAARAAHPSSAARARLVAGLLNSSPDKATP